MNKLEKSFLKDIFLIGIVILLAFSGFKKFFEYRHERENYIKLNVQALTKEMYLNRLILNTEFIQSELRKNNVINEHIQIHLKENKFILSQYQTFDLSSDESKIVKDFQSQIDSSNSMFYKSEIFNNFESLSKIQKRQSFALQHASKSKNNIVVLYILLGFLLLLIMAKVINEIFYYSLYSSIENIDKIDKQLEKTLRLKAKLKTKIRSLKTQKFSDNKDILRA